MTCLAFQNFKNLLLTNLNRDHITPQSYPILAFNSTFLHQLLLLASLSCLQINAVTVDLFLMLEILLGAFALFLFLALYLVRKIDKKAIRDPKYYELTILLGSGGHTGEMCELVRGLHFSKSHKINIVISSTDKTSQGFFESSLAKYLSSTQLEQTKAKLTYHYIPRTNQVKQSYISALFSTIKATYSTFRLILDRLSSTTHLISNGPGTCIPLFYLFYCVRIVKLSRVKLIFFESWCRVEDLSLSGKLVRPIADEFIVHWPELAAKYKKCKYYGSII